MRQTGTLRKNTPAANNNGGYDDHYADVLTCRGKLAQLKASKAMEQGEIVQNKEFEWICRFQTAIVIDADSIWVIAGQIYRIADWEKVDQRPHWYRFTLNQWQ